MKRPRLIVCDLDGTLMDSMPMVVAAFRHAVLPWRNYPDDAELRSHLSGNYLACLRRLLPPDAPLDQAALRLVAYSEAHESDSVLFADTESFLAAAAGSCRLALWTNRDRDSTAKHCARLGIDHHFEDRVCGDDFPTHKPDPEGAHALLARCGVQAADALFVGDSDVDVEGGAAAGMPTVLIRHGQRFPRRLEELAVAVVDTQQEAYRWILDRLQ